MEEIFSIPVDIPKQLAVVTNKVVVLARAEANEALRQMDFMKATRMKRRNGTVSVIQMSPNDTRQEKIRHMYRAEHDHGIFVRASANDSRWAAECFGVVEKYKRELGYVTPAEIRAALVAENIAANEIRDGRLKYRSRRNRRKEKRR